MDDGVKHCCEEMQKKSESKEMDLQAQEMPPDLQWL